MFQQGLYRCWDPDGQHTWTRWIYSLLRPERYRWCTICHYRERRSTV